jgi:formate hydrogenlyase subunit 6/NADH:ubiquinone oxidoreductase subunit I
MDQEKEKITLDYSICTGCGVCVHVCPKKSIVLSKSSKLKGESSKLKGESSKLTAKR